MELQISHTIYNLIIFVLAIYVGYHVVWKDRSLPALGVGCTLIVSVGMADFFRS